jgi:hypothetical protein
MRTGSWSQGQGCVRRSLLDSLNIVVQCHDPQSGPEGNCWHSRVQGKGSVFTTPTVCQPRCELAIVDDVQPSELSLALSAVRITQGDLNKTQNPLHLTPEALKPVASGGLDGSHNRAGV